MTHGMNARTGAPLEGLDHLRQSITDILRSRKGTRVMRRDYGSDIPKIIDSPINDEFALDLYIAVAEALQMWEPRFRLRNTSFSVVGAGAIELALTGEYLSNGKEIKVEGVIVK